MALINWTAGFEGTPAGSDPGSVIDDRIQELKEQIARRLEQGGQILTDDPRGIHAANSHSNRDGRHVVDAGGAGIGPDIYKSPTTDPDVNTKLVAYTDAGVSIAGNLDLTGGGDFTADQITGAGAAVLDSLTVTNDLDPDGNVNQPAILGGTTDRAIVQDNTNFQIVATTAETVMLTIPALTASADAASPTRQFMVHCMAQVGWGATSPPADNRFGFHIEVNVNGAGWVDCSHVEDTIFGGVSQIGCFGTDALSGTGDFHHHHIFGYHQAAVNAVTVQFRVSGKKEVVSPSLQFNRLELIAWERM